MIGWLVRRELRAAYELGRALGHLEARRPSRDGAAYAAGDEAGYRRGVRDGRVFEQQLRLVEAKGYDGSVEKAPPLRLVK